MTEPTEPQPPALAGVSFNPPAWAERTFRALLLLCAVVVFLDYTINYLQLASDETIQDMFNIAREGSFGSWFSTTVTAAIGAALWVIYARLRPGPARRPSVRGWAVLSFFFFYLSIDDGIRFHEEVAGALQDYLVGTTEAGKLPTGPMGPIARLLEANPSYPWLMLFGPVIGALGLYMVWFLWRSLDRGSVKRAVLAVGMLALGQAQDFVEGLEPSPYDALTARFGLDDYTLPHYGKVFEETLEMVGMCLLLYVFLVAIHRTFTAQPGGAGSNPPDEVRAGAPLEGEG